MEEKIVTDKKKIEFTIRGLKVDSSMNDDTRKSVSGYLIVMTGPIGTNQNFKMAFQFLLQKPR